MLAHHQFRGQIGSTVVNTSPKYVPIMSAESGTMISLFSLTPNVRRALKLRYLCLLGLGVLCFGSPPAVGATWRISCLAGPVRWGRIIYTRRRLPFLYYVGIELVEAPRESLATEVELAA